MTEKNMTHQADIQKAVIFEQSDVQLNEPNGTAAESQSDEVIMPATAVANSYSFEQVVIEREDNDETSNSGRKWVWFAGIVILLSLIEAGFWIEHILTQSDWLSGAWLIVIVAALIFALKAFISELRSLRQLKKTEQLRTQSIAFLSAPTIGQGKAFCEQLTPLFLPLYPNQINQWQQAIQPHHVDKEVLQLFETNVLSAADKHALQVVTKHASASAAMIAVSPFALLDMIIVLWRNLVMLKQVSQCYGLPLSYWGRIRLIKQVFKTMLLAGATEIISDAGNYAVSAGVTGKLSTRLAQGIGVGVMTTRVGIKAMQTCRPMPWNALAKPGINQLTQQLLSDLKSLTKK